MLILEIAAGVVLGGLILRHWKGFVALVWLVVALVAIGAAYLFFPTQTLTIGGIFVVMGVLGVIVVKLPERFLPSMDPNAEPSSWLGKPTMQIYREWKAGRGQRAEPR